MDLFGSNHKHRKSTTKISCFDLASAFFFSKNCWHDYARQIYREEDLASALVQTKMWGTIKLY
jgi:hypothetical protein